MTQGFRLAFRRLRSAPLFSVSVCAALGLTNAAILAAGMLAYAVLLAPLPYEDPQELVFVQTQSLRTGGAGPFSPADYLDIRKQSRTLALAAAAEAWSPVRSGENAAERITGLRVSGDLFSLLGVAPELGRTIKPADDAAGGTKVVVISQRLWLRLFGGNPTAINRSIRLDGEEFTVVGVMPSGFEFPTFWQTGVDVWSPFQWTTQKAAGRNASSLRVFGRLAPGVTTGQALAEIQTISASLRAAFPESHADRGASVIGIQDATVLEVRPVLLALAGGAALLWLIALANVTVLAVVRATGRMTEAAVRRALGESWAAGLRRDGTESLMLAALGTTVGAFLAFWAIQLLLARAPRGFGVIASRWETLPSLLWTGVGIAAVTVISAAALATAGRWAFPGGPIVDRLRARAEAGASRRATTIRSLLTGGEIALAVVLTAAAGLVCKSLLALVSVNPGFDPVQVTTAVVPVTGSSFGDPARKAGFYQSLLERLRQAPGVESAAAVNHVPLVGDRWGLNFVVEGADALQPGSEPNAAYRVATPGYFTTIGAQLAAGRDFTAADHRDAPSVIVVNQTFARQYLGPDALLSRIRFGGPEGPWREVVGIVADLQQISWADVGAEIFVPFEQDQSFRESPRSPFAMTVVVRSSGTAGSAVAALRQIVADLDPAIPVDRIITLDDAVDAALWQPRLTATLMGVFGLIALLLAGIGVYGTAAQTVAARRTEFGVRMALGATNRKVLALAVQRSAQFVLAGIALGALAAWSLSDLLADLLYQVSAQDGYVFAAACSILGLIGLLASYLAARRAAATDPATALRQD
ncbi:MAG: ADOP family duplicated permease [Acidobacteria bacterium]|nr:ADOP family duplicated permease [Acidobacteriota bacterium]MDA1234373.1 ADOP family duplicated permease [Acidobacteriota bacterium]